MRYIQRLSIACILFSALFGSLGNATPAFACSCVETTSAEQFNDASAIFVGIPVSISEDGEQRSIDFDVSESRKGTVANHINVTTGSGDADCGFNFEIGKEYIVYTDGQEQLSTSICTGTSLLTATAQDNEIAFTGNPGLPTTESSVRDNSIIPFVIVALISYGVGASTGYLARRKKLNK